MGKETVNLSSMYTLGWNPGKITTTKYVLYAVQIAVVILLSWLGAVATPVVGPGIGFLYWAYPFFVVFTLWWGFWGILGAWIGSVVGAGLLTGLPIIPSLLFSVGDFVPALLIFLLYRGYLVNHGIDPFGRDIFISARATTWFVVWVMGITNIFGGMWGVWVLTILGFVPVKAYWLGAGLWIVGDAIVLILMPFLSRYLTPIVERFGLLNKGWIS
uniref:MASE1 domain-containing protein n=1 Tax=Mesoaciditoga lauensis TaxID=1495039 RepID=A0A7V3RDY6_9BACT